MPAQALIRYIAKSKVEQLIADAGLQGKLIISEHGKHQLVKVCKDGEELEAGELLKRAAALQAICDADAEKMPQPKPIEKKKVSALAAAEKPSASTKP